VIFGFLTTKAIKSMLYVSSYIVLFGGTAIIAALLERKKHESENQQHKKMDDS
jgi:hypothetical protein